MNQIPTLVLGIGGVGCKIAAGISDMLSDNDRKYVSVVGIDTNVNDIAKLRDKHKMEIIQTSDDREVSDYLEDHPEYCEWFPDNDFLRERTMTDGAGQVRTLSRLAFLASVENGRFTTILQEVTRIRRVDGNPLNNNLTIIVVGSITGGTGAGLFLNIPFYLRDLIKTQVGINRCVIRGLFVGPDILEDVQPSKINKDAVCVNGYTCLKEVNAFYMRPMVGREIAKNLRLEYYNHEDKSVQNIPYDYLYIVEKSGAMGTVGDAHIEEIINYIARVVFVMMFSPITADALSVEDNFILSRIEEGGMNRYAGAGMCRLMYPIKTAQEYVTLSVVRNLVQSEWMLIDKEFDALTKAALSKMVSDPTVVKPEIETSYVEIFEKEALGDHAKLGRFVQEAYNEKESKYISKANEFIEKLDGLVDELMESDDVLEKEEACKIDDQKMKTFSDAEGEINKVWEGMRNYSRYAKNQIDIRPNGFADDLFPVSREVMEFHKDKPECIYQFLAKVHPVTARFLIYDIINKLKAKIKELKDETTGVNLSVYMEEDFDPKREGVQGPSDTLASIRDKRHPIWKILGPVGKFFNSEEKSLIKLKRRLHDVCDTHISTTHDFLENSLKYSVSQLVLERMIQLANNYAIFFSVVGEKISRNKDNIDRLENIHFPFGQDGIYCSKEAFQKMAKEFQIRQSQDLSEETKIAIFEQVYLVQARSFMLTDLEESKAAKERRLKEDKKRLEDVFNTAVIDTIKDSVIKNGSDIVNFNARQALIKEFEMTENMTKDDPGYEDKKKEYVQDRIATALKIASPMLTTEMNHPDTELTFLAVSPDCAETDAALNPDTSETAKFYLPTVGKTTTVIIEPEFDDTEITCIRLKYNYTIEELTKYREGTRNAEAYKDRIMNLGKKREFSYNSNEMLVVINPHLNCNWNEEGFIPSIYTKQREKDRIDNLKAFIYAMGLDKFKLILDDDMPDDKGNPRPTWYAYTDSYIQAKPILKCGRLIGNGYSDVLDAIRYNRMLKRAVLFDAKSLIEKMKGYSTTEELFDEILENWFVEDLIQPKGDEDTETAEDAVDTRDKNIFDIFLIMRSHMPDSEWNTLFEGLLLTIWEFCDILFDKSVIHINKATKSILTEIYKNCSVSKKSEDTLPKSERMLLEQYRLLLNKNYEN